MIKKKCMNIWGIALGVSAVLLVGAALREQLSKPPEQRTWQGHILGVPYDFRLPTFGRIRETVWNKNTSCLVVPHAFGMGWSINFYPLFHPRTP